MDICRACGTRPLPPRYEVRPDLAKKVKDQLAESFLKRRYILVTLTAMEKPGLAKVMQRILVYKMEEHTATEIVVVSAAIDQLKCDAASPDASRAYLRDNYALLERMRQSGYLELLNGTVAEEGAVFGVFLQSCKATDSILVLGNNMSLNTSVYLRNQRNEKNEKYVWVQERSVSSKGFLPKTGMADEAVFGPAPGDSRIVATIQNGNTGAKERFEIKIEETSATDRPVPLTGGVPTRGETVYFFRNNEWMAVVLGDELGRGGEAVIYQLPQTNLCAKIFFPQNLTQRKLKKVELLCKHYPEMQSRDNSVIQRISWPQEMIYNRAKEPVGFSMLMFTDVKSFDSFSPNSYRDYVRNSKKRAVVAAISMVELIRFLHNNNVILCDINKGNILFDKEQKAYLVDLDSAQVTDPHPRTILRKPSYQVKSSKGAKSASVNVIGEAVYVCYPANVAVPMFLPPEHIDDTSYDFLHEKADDVWQTQYLLFLLVTMGSAFFPYAGNADSPEGKSAIRQGKYQFHKNYFRDEPIPEDPRIEPLIYMHRIISRLSSELREAFFDAFSSKGRKFRAADRDDAKIWMKWLVKYYYELPEREKRDAENGVVAPNSVKYEDRRRVTANIRFDRQLQILDEFDSWLAQN